MKTTIVVTTYNGSDFIKEQLESLRVQSRMPDEVLILDDGSTDNTTSIVQGFIDRNNLTSWKLLKNSLNVGWKQNFIKGMGIASGDIIFPCDQDDVWHKDKIDIMAGVFEKNPKVFVLQGIPHKWFYNDKVTGIAKKETFRQWIGKKLDKNEKILQCSNTQNIRRGNFDTSFLRSFPGCVLAVRKSYFETIKHCWIPEIPHDLFLSIHSKLDNGYYKLDYEVIEWRKHNKSTTHDVLRNRTRRIQELDIDSIIIKYTKDQLADKKLKSANYSRIIEGALEWCTLRKNIVVNHKMTSIFPLLKYRYYYVQFRRYFTDIQYGVMRSE